MHAVAGQRVQVGGQGGHQGLAFAGLHFGDASVVEHHAADELDVEMAHAERAPGRLAHHREGLGEQVVEPAPALQALAELRGLGLQRGIVEPLDLGLEGVDPVDGAAHPTQHPLVAAAENLLRDGA